MPKPILEIPVKDFMTARAKIRAVKKTDTIQRVVSILIDSGVHQVAVFDGNAFAGFLGYKQLARLHRRPVAQTQVNDYIIRPPAVSPASLLIDAAEAMYRLNYKVLPVMEGNTLVGLISESDILNAAMEIEELRNARIKEFMTPSPITLNTGDRLGAAMMILREKNVSRIPVVNKGGTVAGILESLDVLREMYTKEASYGVSRSATNDPKKGSVTVDAFASDEIADGSIAVEALMKKMPVLAKAEDAVGPAFSEAMGRGMTSIIVVDAKQMPIGIVVPKDILQHIARLKQKEGIYIQISGLESEYSVTDFQKEQVHRMIDDSVRKLAKIMNVQFFTMHFKSYHTDGKRKKYSIRCKADTDQGLFVVRDYGWDIIDTTSKILESFEKLLITRQQKARTIMRERNRHKKHAINEVE